MLLSVMWIHTGDTAKMKLPPGSTDTENSSVDENSSSQQDVDFSDYMWMGEEMEEFDSKVTMTDWRVYGSVIVREMQVQKNL